MAPIMEACIATLLIAGSALALIGSYGLAKLADFYKRLHGPTKATTLGVGCVLVASSVWFSGQVPGISIHEVMVTLFLFLTAPVSAHLLVRAKRHAEDGHGTQQIPSDDQGSG